MGTHRPPWAWICSTAEAVKACAFTVRPCPRTHRVRRRRAARVPRAAARRCTLRTERAGAGRRRVGRRRVRTLTVRATVSRSALLQPITLTSWRPRKTDVPFLMCSCASSRSRQAPRTWRDAHEDSHLVHQAILEERLVRDLRVGSGLVQDVDLEEAIVGSDVARSHGAADQLRHTPVQRHLASLETGTGSVEGQKTDDQKRNEQGRSPCWTTRTRLLSTHTKPALVTLASGNTATLAIAALSGSRRIGQAAKVILFSPSSKRRVLSEGIATLPIKNLH